MMTKFDIKIEKTGCKSLESIRVSMKNYNSDREVKLSLQKANKKI